jgi:hypothetical protein
LSEKPAPPTGDSGQRVTISYIKSNAFRVIFADGAYGGATPRGNIQFSFYNERNAIPQEAEIELIGGEVSSERITRTRGGMVREVEVNVVLSLQSAREFKDWLEKRIEFTEKIVGEADGTPS